MARVEIRQLRYRGELARAGQVEFAVADALRTEVVDDGRLMLVRSFALGRIRLSERGASLAAARAWRAIREGARHGRASGAENANCVWFADAAEARTLLMRELASGRTPFAWFWVLAVPEWRREPLGPWLGRRLEEAARDASGETAAALVAEALAADCVELLAAAILARIRLPRNGDLSPADHTEEALAQRDVSVAPPDRALHAVGDAAAQAAALAIARTLPASFRTFLATAPGRSRLAAFTETLARGMAVRAHPALTLAPARLSMVAAVVARIWRIGEPHALPTPSLSRSPAGEVRPGAQDAPASSPGSTIDREVVPAFDERPLAQTAPPVVPPSTEQPSAHADAFPAELPSSAAGLFLAITPLIRLGWREWLAERPHLLLHQPGPRLLRQIAARYRVPAVDALWSQLPPVDPADEPPSEFEQSLHVWRAGLDGWLRRKARLRLADLVLRQGCILPGVETTFVRFPLQAIEIRLRRLALDADPGWVDWLGHSYRVVYRDRPLLGPEAV